jgi:catechol-2,3-dioxygenase
MTGIMSVSLTVVDPVKSADWYASVLGLEIVREYVGPSGRDICLRRPGTELELCLLDHSKNPGDPFSEFRTGLDHLEFLVSQRADLDDWAAHLDSLGVSHSGVKGPAYSSNAMLTFRDPDNIQLELFWRADSNRRP